MKKIEFVSLEMALGYAKQFGGWLFNSKDENISIWYDPSHYTMTNILKDSPTSGTIGTYSTFK